MITEQKPKVPVRKAYPAGTSWVVTIDPTLVRALDIDEETYFSEELVDKGIMLRVRRLTS